MQESKAQISATPLPPKPSARGFTTEPPTQAPPYTVTWLLTHQPLFLIWTHNQLKDGSLYYHLGEMETEPPKVKRWWKHYFLFLSGHRSECTWTIYSITYLGEGALIRF